MVVMVLTGSLALLAVLAIRFGADSREDNGSAGSSNVPSRSERGRRRSAYWTKWMRRWTRPTWDASRS